MGLTDRIELEFVPYTDPRYSEIVVKHYAGKLGQYAQQVHFLVLLDERVVGIISGGSATQYGRPRDQFFDLTDIPDKTSSPVYNSYRQAILSNTVFRLEESVPNLGTAVLGVWRRVVVEVWRAMYGVEIMGFETFVDASEVNPDGRYLNGSLYAADNWTYCGRSDGTAKKRKADDPEHEGTKHGMARPIKKRPRTNPKLVYCRWRSKMHRRHVPPPFYAGTTWMRYKRGEDGQYLLGGVERARMSGIVRERDSRRKAFTGVRFRVQAGLVSPRPVDCLKELV